MAKGKVRGRESMCGEGLKRPIVIIIDMMIMMMGKDGEHNGR